MKKKSAYILTGLCLGVLGGAFIFKNTNRRCVNEYDHMSSERRLKIMTDLKIPSFMKKKESTGHDMGKYLAVNRPINNKKELVELDETDIFFDDEDEIIPSEIPVETCISPKQADEIEKEMENMNDYNNEVNEALTDAEKDALRKYIRAMDTSQLEIVLEEIPMELIIAHFGKKWKEAEVFRNNIAAAMSTTR